MDYNAVDIRASTHVVPVLRAEFRYVSRKEDTCIGQDHLRMLRWERSIRGSYGYLVPYQCVEFTMFCVFARATRYVSLPRDWREWEVPLGFLVELPAVLTYFGTRLMRNTDLAWVLFQTEWVINVAAALLWEVYDTYRLFWLPQRLCEGIRSSDLNWLLGSKKNADELLDLVSVIENVDWSRVSWRQRRRKVPPHPKVSLTVRTDNGGDFIWYDPFERREMSAEEAQERHTMPKPQLPAQHPTGYVYVDEGSAPVGSGGPLTDAALAAAEGMNPNQDEEDSDSLGDNGPDEMEEDTPQQDAQTSDTAAPIAPLAANREEEGEMNEGVFIEPLSGIVPATATDNDGPSRAKNVRQSTSSAAGASSNADASAVSMLQDLLRQAGADLEFDSMEGAVAGLRSIIGKRRASAPDAGPSKVTRRNSGSSSASSIAAHERSLALGSEGKRPIEKSVKDNKAIKAAQAASKQRPSAAVMTAKSSKAGSSAETKVATPAPITAPSTAAKPAASTPAPIAPTPVAHLPGPSTEAQNITPMEEDMAMQTPLPESDVESYMEED